MQFCIFEVERFNLSQVLERIFIYLMHLEKFVSNVDSQQVAQEINWK
ncbi:hypothetical protein Gasu2_44060, partial [Galdieria sulphuraria]